jgi:hypothetical protein
MSSLVLMAQLTATRVQSIRIDARCFTGTLPSKLSMLTRLESLVLVGERSGCKNDLGPIPDSWATTMKGTLRVLGLDSAGALSPQSNASSLDWWPKPWVNASLTELSLTNAGLQSALPADLPVSLPKLKCLDLKGNRLVGTVPSEYFAAQGNWKGVNWKSATGCSGFEDNVQLEGCAPKLNRILAENTRIIAGDVGCTGPEWLVRQNAALAKLRELMLPILTPGSSNPPAACETMAGDLKTMFPDGLVGTPYCKQEASGGVFSDDPFSIVSCVYPDAPLVNTSSGVPVRLEVGPGRVSAVRLGVRQSWAGCTLLPNISLDVLLPSVLQPLSSHLEVFEAGWSALSEQAYPLVGTLPPEMGSQLPNLSRFVAERTQLEGFLPDELIVPADFRLIANQGLEGNLPPGWGNWSQSNISILISGSPDIIGSIPREWSGQLQGKPWIGPCVTLVDTSVSGCVPDGLVLAAGEWCKAYEGMPLCSREDGQVQALMRTKVLLGPGVAGNWVGGADEVYALVDGPEGLLPAFCVRWEGVQCSKEGWVTHLEVPIQQGSRATRSGTPPSLADVIDGVVPLKGLRVLNLSGQGLTGPLPIQLADFAQLTQVDLSRNSLTGILPEAWLSLQRLEVLWLSDNSLSGELPVVYIALQSLRELNLARNRLTGPLQPEWGLLEDLLALDLSSNLITGLLPLSWADSSALQAAVVSRAASLGMALPATQGQMSGGVATALASALAQASGSVRATQQPGATVLLPQQGPLPQSESKGAGLGPPPPAGVEGASATVQAVSAPLASLRRLNLMGNMLSGSLPRGWKTMTGLEVSCVGEGTHFMQAAQQFQIDIT